MNDLPKGWEWKTVGEITECLDSKRVPITKNLREEGEIPYYGANGIQGYVKDFIFDEELLLLAEDGGSWGKNQKCVNIIRGKSWVNNHAHVLRMKSSVLIKFLEAYLNMADLTKYINGTTRGKLNQKQMNNIEVPLPPIKIQKEIVALLEHAQSLKQKREEANDDTNSIIQSIFNEMFGDPVKNEKEWDTVTFSEIISDKKHSLKRGPFGGALKKEIFVDKGYLVYEQYHALNNDYSFKRYFINEDTFNSLKSFEVKEGDILISCSGVYLGKLSIVPKGAMKGIINQALLKVTLNNKVMNSLFFVNTFRHPSFRKNNISTSGSGIPNLPPMSFMKKIRFVNPPISPQNQFAEMIEKIESIKLKQLESTSDINNLFDALMQKAFNGELVE